jgi:hypothetical protein
MMWDVDWVVKLGMNRECWPISMRFKLMWRNWKYCNIRTRQMSGWGKE